MRVRLVRSHHRNRARPEPVGAPTGRGLLVCPECGASVRETLPACVDRVCGAVPVLRSPRRCAVTPGVGRLPPRRTDSGRAGIRRPRHCVGRPAWSGGTAAAVRALTVPVHRLTAATASDGNPGRACGHRRARRGCARGGRLLPPPGGCHRRRPRADRAPHGAGDRSPPNTSLAALSTCAPPSTVGGSICPQQTQPSPGRPPPAPPQPRRALGIPDGIAARRMEAAPRLLAPRRNAALPGGRPWRLATGTPDRPWWGRYG
jgi:hypothetical protein